MKTLFVDLDGCCFKSYNGLDGCMSHSDELNVLPGVRERFEEWFMKNYSIVITTGRPESWREETIYQIKANGLWYDHLLMGLKHQPRVLINDGRPDGTPSATAIILNKNEGMKNLNV